MGVRVAEAEPRHAAAIGLRRRRHLVRVVERAGLIGAAFLLHDEGQALLAGVFVGRTELRSDLRTVVDVAGFVAVSDVAIADDDLLAIVIGGEDRVVFAVLRFAVGEALKLCSFKLGLAIGIHADRRAVERRKLRRCRVRKREHRRTTR